VNAAAWQSVFRGALAKGHDDVALEVYRLAFAVDGTRGACGAPPTVADDREQWLGLLLPALGDAGRWQDAIDVVDSAAAAAATATSNPGAVAPTHGSLTALLRVLCKGSVARIDLALEYHRKALVKARLARGPPTAAAAAPARAVASFSPASTAAAPATAAGPAPVPALEVFVAKVSQDLLQQLAIMHEWNASFALLEDVHAAMRSYHVDHKHARPATTTAAIAASGAEDGRSGALLSLLYTTAMRYTVSDHLLLHSKGQAQRLLEHQRRLGVRPRWSCVVYALKALYVEEQWELLLDLFAVRTQTTGYRGGEELAYIRALKACRELGHWQEALELLADLLVERNAVTGAASSPPLTHAHGSGSGSVRGEPLGSSVFELTLETLAAAGQREMVKEVVKLMNANLVTPTARITSIVQDHSSGKASVGDIIRGVGDAHDQWERKKMAENHKKEARK
jgi:hypothetical protein